MLPSQKDIELPLLEVLEELGGQGWLNQIELPLRNKFPKITDVDRAEKYPSDNNKWETKIRIARNNLKRKGEVDAPSRGIWRITEKGKNRLKLRPPEPQKSQKINSDTNGQELIIDDQTMVNIYEFIKNEGFYFPKEIITTYYLALKTKPFVILTGISGTGKTKIAQLFSEYMCAENSMDLKNKDPIDSKKSHEEATRRYVFVSVRPDWMDNRGILGFYNFLTEKYEATELIKLLLRAKKEYEEKREQSRPYFVILDEMNLSKVEQYFSDFLSCLESRTPDNPEGEPIILHNNPLDKDGKKIKLQTEELMEIPDKIKIPPNVYFSGTVNIDETTYMFSHKVLDRANVIEFNEVDLSRYFEDDSKDVSQFILQKKPELTVSLPVTKKIYDNAEMLNVYKTHLEEINRRLTPHNLHFGYRVVSEIGAYLKNAEEMVTDYQDKMDDAFDFQIRQKILTKFHGSRQKIEKPLQDIFLYLNGDPIEKFENQNLAQSTITEEHGKLKGWITKDGKSFDYSGKFPRSAAKILRMLKNLHEQGFTSYIE